MVRRQPLRSRVQRPSRRPRSRAAAAIAAALLLLALAPAGTRDEALPGPGAAGPAVGESFDLRTSEGAPRPIVDHLARRYRISSAAAEETADAAYLAASEAGVDPLLILAVIGVESSFNPAAESSVGAKGLMQIVPHYHRARLTDHGGEALVFEPFTNVAVGTRILVDYIERAGSVAAGLQSYNGAPWDTSERYAQRVIAERELLQRIAGPRTRDD